jgi:integrase
MRDMPRPRPKYLLREKRGGVTVWVFRRDKKSPRIVINGAYGSEEFLANYDAAYHGRTPEKVELRGRAGTLSWLVDRWQDSSDWKNTSVATRRQRDNILIKVLEKSGRVAFADITKADIINGREKRMETPFAANNFIKTMRALFRWAVRVDHLKEDPTKDVAMFSKKTDGHLMWSREDISAYRNRWPLGTRARVAFEVLYCTGMRRGDVVRIGRQHFDETGRGAMKTEKTGTEVYPEITPALAEALQHGPTGDLVFIVGADGKPMTKESFGNSFADWCRAAGVDKSAHGLRKTAATEAAESGCTEEELKAMFGWENDRTSSIYTKKASRRKMAIQAQDKRNGNILSPVEFQGQGKLEKLK